MTRFDSPHNRPLAAMGARASAVLLVAGLIGLWYVASEERWIAPIVLASPQRTINALIALVQNKTFWGHVGVTALEIGLGWLLSVVSAVVLATACYGSVVVRTAVHPYLVLFQSFPKVLLVPVLGVLLAYGTQLTIALVWLGVFFPSYHNMLVGYESAPASSRDLMRTLRASRLQTFRMLLVPGALPMMFTGLRQSMAIAGIVVLIGEFAGARQGLGYLIATSAFSLRTPVVYAAIIAVSVLSGLYYLLVVVAERCVLRAWSR